jgi:hypothetical protein
MRLRLRGRVISGWHKKIKRLSRMSWEEVRSRTGQEFGKHVDLAIYHLGLNSTTGLLLPSPNRTPKFFFAKQDLPRRVKLLQDHLSHEIAFMLEEADRICQHEFHLLGYEKLQYGPEIDWQLDRVHGKRAPLKPWFKIDFLNFSEVGDHKVTWELNRHQHLVTLAKAACLTGHKKYSEELIQQWYSWRRANPYPLGINWASALEAAFRSLSWLWVRNLLAGRDIPSDFDADLLHSLGESANYIARFLSTYFSPNTHLLGEALALLSIGTLCPELRSSQKWQDLGWRILLQECERQVRPDGVYFEQSLYYHVYALDFLLYARILAAQNDLLIPEKFDRQICKMLDVIQALSDVGPPEGFGDDDGGRVFNARRNHTEHMTDPLAIGATLYGNQYAPATLTEEAIWLFGDQAVCAVNPEYVPTVVYSASFPSGGIYLISDKKPCFQKMAIDAGPQGTGRAGHGHADALSIRLSIDQERILVDAGTGSYMLENQRRKFRGTAAHNTLTVDGLDQAVDEGPFAWSRLPRTQTETWVSGESFDLFVGSHDGYSRLPKPVTHRRLVFHVHGGFWLVHDLAEGQGSHQLDIGWHFAPGMSVIKNGDVFLAATTGKNHNGDTPSRARLALLPAQVKEWSCDVEWDYVSPAYGKQLTSPHLRMSCQSKLPKVCTTLLLPLMQAGDCPGRLSDLSTRGNERKEPVHLYRYTDPSKVHYIGIPDREQSTWRVGPIESDARFLYFATDNERLVHFIFCEGTIAKLEGKEIVKTSHNIQRFEWVKASGENRIHSSDPGTPGISEEILDSNFALEMY